MKLSKLAIMSMTGLALSSPTLAAANDTPPQRYLYLGGHIGWNFLDIGGHYDDLTDSPGGYFLPGLQAGYRFADNWSLQGTWERSKNSTELFGDDDVNTNVLTASLRRHFNTGSFEPYVGIGAGEYRTKYRDSHDESPYPETIGTLEGGFQKWLGSRWLLDVGARPYYSFRTERWDTTVYAGLSYAIGLDRPEEASKPRPVAGVRDGDGDGVPDDRDACPDTPRGALVDDTGCQLYLEHDIRETLYVEFAHDKAEVRHDSYPRLQNLARKMTEYPSAKVVLNGHTDSTGSASYNQALSQKRAAAVKAVLFNYYNVSPDRITTNGYGESRPIADNSTAEGRARNRRVEAILKATSKEAAYDQGSIR